MSVVISEEYMSSLRDLTFNSRPLISMLTMLADDYHSEAPSIALTIETHLSRIRGDRIPILYLIDSIVKNVGKDYVALFSRNLPTLFAAVFEKAKEEKLRSNLYKLRTTWDGIFSLETLSMLDTLVNVIDPEWPVTSPPLSTNIHINPEFINRGNVRRAAVSNDIMRERILKEKKVLLELQKKKVELELLQTQEVLEKEQKKLESYTFTIKGDSKPPSVLTDQKSLQIIKETHPHSSSVMNVDSENSKKLLEVSYRDPRMKSRQTDVASDSPLSGTSSPIPSRTSVTSFDAKRSSPISYHSDSSRERPPKKKHKSKEKRKHKDKDIVKELKKSNENKLYEGVKKKNGHPHKSSRSQERRDETMEFDRRLVEETDENSKQSCDSSVFSRFGELSSDTSTFAGGDVVTDPGRPVDFSTVTDCTTVQLLTEEVTNDEFDKTYDVISRPMVTEPLPCNNDDKSSIPPLLRSRDPRTSRVSSRSAINEVFNTNESSSNRDTTTIPSNRDTKLDTGKPLVSSSTVSGFSEKPAPTKSFDEMDPFEAMGGTDSVSDLISTLSSVDENERKTDVEMVDSSSRDSFATRSSSEIPPSFLTEQTKLDNIPSTGTKSPVTTAKITASKRKVDPEQDREDQKRMLLSESHEEKSLSENLPVPVSCSNSVSTAATQPLEQQPMLAPETPPLPPEEPPCSQLDDLEKEPDTFSVLSDNSIETGSLAFQNPLPAALPPLIEETGKDVDLRLLLPRPVERPQTSNIEDLKTDANETEPMSLFGGEDVDYRQKPPPQQEFNLPSPPPPPVIGNLQEATSKKSWAQIKDKRVEEKGSPKGKSDKRGEEKSSPKFKSDKLRRSLSQPKSDGDAKENSRSSSQAHCNLLVKEAEEQLMNGNINFVEYNKMLAVVVSINEERILNEARARYSNTPVTPEEESTSRKTPPPEYDSSFDSDLPEHSNRLVNMESYDNRSMEPPPPRIGVNMLPTQTQFPHGPQESFNRVRFDFPDQVMWRDRPPPPNIVSRFPRPPTTGLGGPSIPLSFPPFPASNMPFQPGFRPRMPRNISPPTTLPLVDMELLNEAENDVMDIISIGDTVRKVRFYGMTAVVLPTWDDPREICFPPGQRWLIIDERHKYQLQFGGPPIEVVIDDVLSTVQLGAPTRELYIDEKYYSMQFGGMPVEVTLCGRVRTICLSGPPPIVRYGPVKRTDLVAGTVNLYVNAKSNFLIYLDGKPQKFFLEEHPCVLKFADSLLTVLINNVRAPLEFGGFPVPVMYRGVQHFLRLTVLPMGIIPGQVSIMNMDNFVQPQIPVMMPPPLMPPAMSDPPPPPLFLSPQCNIMPPMVGNVQQPLDLLASVMNPSAPAAPVDRSYSVEQPVAPPEVNPQQPVTAPPAADNKTQQPALSGLNINDLFQKLLQTGLLNNPSEPPEVKKVEEIDADFSKPETLKVARMSLVTKLYSGIQCSSCGIRFPPEGTKMYSRHLDWHFRQNRREKHSTRKPQSRRWYYDLSDWLQYQELDDIDDTEPEPMEEESKGDGDSAEEDMPSVPVGYRKDVICHVCGEKFEEFFNHDTEEWHARNAILVEDLFYHPLCYEEFKTKKELGPTETVEKQEEEEPIVEEPSLVEVIDLDETDTAVPSPVSTNVDSLPLLGPDKADSPEIIALDDNSDSKSEDLKQEEDSKPAEESDDDDDILGIEVIERKIESYELLDDDDDDDIPMEKPESIPDEKDIEEKDQIIDFTKVTIKQEKDRDRPDTVDSSLPTYTATIDGNIVHETAVPLVIPNRIKININRSAKAIGDNDSIEPSGDSNEALALAQPPPPGEDPVEPPQSLKPKLIGVELSNQPPFVHGSELSGLCSIM